MKQITQFIIKKKLVPYIGSCKIYTFGTNFQPVGVVLPYIDKIETFLLPYNKKNIIKTSTENIVTNKIIEKIHEEVIEKIHKENVNNYPCSNHYGDDSAIKLIAAYSAYDYGIGYQNKIPWNINEDLTYFKKITTGNGILFNKLQQPNNLRNAVIMGKNTAISINPNKMPFSHRYTIIISSTWYDNKSFIPNHLNHENIYIFKNISDAIEYAKNELDAHDIFLIGGQQIYEEGINLCEYAYITEIYAENIVCDRFFPKNQLDELFFLIYSTVVQLEGKVRVNFKIFKKR